MHLADSPKLIADAMLGALAHVDRMARILETLTPPE